MELTSMGLNWIELAISILAFVLLGSGVVSLFLFKRDQSQRLLDLEEPD